MMTVNEASKLTGVSIRALQYYDTIGLLPPAGYTEAGYRLYDDTAMERLQQKGASRNSHSFRSRNKSNGSKLYGFQSI